MNLTSEHIWFSKTQWVSHNTIMLLSAGTWSDFGTVMFFFVHFYFIFFKKTNYVFYVLVPCDFLIPTLQYPKNFNLKGTCQDNGFYFLSNDHLCT